MPKGKRNKQAAVNVVQQNKHELDRELEPQAILGRALRFFTLRIHTGTDDLDEFEYAAFCINNSVHFSLRHYRSDPKKITSLYTEPMTQEEAEKIVTQACESFGLNKTALHWIRGQQFVYGKLEPLRGQQLKEKDSRDAVLKAASCFPGRKATTAQIKNFIESVVEFSATDLEPFPSRGSEPRWRQIVGNVISHASSSKSIFSLGYAKKTAQDEVKVTEEGLEYLHSIGFSLADAAL
ncbi:MULTISPECIES: hypothetical protein [unclassified Bradyrhizobium]|uniref:hypothetical protein n=1 Tax=unclassified Bradyrhizobium TaxID=2631580 RepID=UPI001BAAD28E|nr:MULTISPECIES: hypothetical protein [unclassified Bradyrhizobium]MBR1206591.1 hypothetical protein [Bradyrhizobium sp. AUGA SZCCT0124]MBR1315431.1 hypothetical protein [Bradyrhizobium sp. AUGA SZCCT0051]MBR1338507.1 hypothetical protein [Bradyrhizobium sp. AUGA SZCCT0105]MBR1356162.1 hypothetical protein [Bradyrhizobium sp. AUGA SZCCT0045]